MADRKKRGGPGIAGSIADRIEERFGSTWLLLSETTSFLSQTSVFAQYESILMDLRHRLSSGRKDSAVERQIRQELIELRGSLRLQGYDLSLGRLRLSVDGFRNDSCIGQGFRRIVLFIGVRSLWLLSGEDNHINLHDQLERILAMRPRNEDSEILQKHSLWYLRDGDQIILSGADSEPKEDFEKFEAWTAVPEHRLQLLSRLRSLR